MPSTQSLNDLNWTVTRTAGEAPVRVDNVPASVPGCVHLDLMAADLIPDPYVGENEKDVQWIGLCDFAYQAEFQADADVLGRGRVELAFEELDTDATVLVNDVEVGRACNQHHPHAFDVKGALRDGTNTIEVRFGSALNLARRRLEEMGERPHAGNGSNEALPHNFVRKMSCNMGWDWGPILITCGISGAVSLRGFDVARLESVRPLTTDVKDGSATLDVLVEIDRQRGGPLDVRCRLRSPAGELVAEQVVTATGSGVGNSLTVADPQLWWPRGHGDQPLYTLETELLHDDGVIDRRECRVGLRIVRLDQREDEDFKGSRFAWWVNGRPIVAKGANWIPDDCFPVRVTRDDLRRSLDEACAANLNMLRIWGGGKYASHDLLDLADERGIMVAQDFLFACAAYAEEEPIRSQVIAEARHQVTDLARHASLVHWNGCNENLWGYEEWGWKGQSWPEALDGKTWGAGYYFEILPRVLLELDPTRTYTPGSPFSKVRDERANDPARGTVHVWPMPASASEYRRLDARLVNEFGQQGPPAMATLTRALGEDAPDQNGPAMAHRQRAHGGNKERINDRIAERYGKDAADLDFDTWHYLAQLHQARAVSDGIDWWRSRFPHNMGTVYWQWNDCWPVTSWAAIDSENRRKLLWYATRSAYSPRRVLVQPAEAGDYAPGDPLRAVVLNDSADELAGELVVRRLAFDGTEKVRLRADVRVPAFSAVPVPLSAAKLQQPADPAGELVVAELDGVERGVWFFLPEGDCDLPAADLSVEANGREVTVTANRFARDVCLFPDRAAADLGVDTNLVTLLPGESHTFTLTAEPPADTDWANPLLRCVNE